MGNICGACFKSEWKAQDYDVTPIKDANVPIIWVLGGPGSGKGTQCDKIVEKYGFTKISTGDLLRDEAQSGTKSGKKLKAMMDKGELVPLNAVLNLLTEAMLNAAKDTKGYVIDGYPRELQQAQTFEKKIGECTMILFFDCNEDTMTQRLLDRGREDDTDKAIKKRIEVFNKYNKPILDQYGDKVKTVNAEADPDAVFEEVCGYLDPMVPAEGS